MKYYLKKNKLAIIIVSILFIASCFLCVFINNVGLSENDVEITKLDINLKINKDGSGTFNNYVTYDFEGVDAHVVYEDIGYKKDDVFAYGDINGDKSVEQYNNKQDQSSIDTNSFVTKVYQGKKELDLYIGYSFENDVEIDPEGQGYIKADGSYQERVYCYYEKGFNEETTFNYQYKINGIVSKFNDIGVVNWILSPSTEFYTKNIDINIVFEETLNETYVEHLKNNFNIYGNIAYNDLKIDNNGISFHVDKQRSNQSIEVRMGFNSVLVSNADEKNTYDYNGQEYLTRSDNLAKEAYELYSKRYFGIQLGLIIGMVIIIGLTVLIWRHCYKKYDKERVSEFDAEYYRELPNTYPPAELGYLYNFKDTTKDDLSATIMDLIRKDYIILDTNGVSTLDEKPNYKYILNREKDQTLLKSYEKFVLEWYFGHISQTGVLTLDDIDNYLKNEKQAQRYLEDNKTFIKLVREESRKNKFFDEFRNINSRFMLFYLLLIGVFVFSLMVQILNYYTYGLIFSMLSLGIFILLACYISSIKRRSESGNEDYVRWRAFRNFLLEFGRFEDYTMPLIEIWEHYMVYAVSFGIAEEVEKQMRLRFKSMGEDEYNSYYSSSPIFYSRSYIYVSRSCRSSTTIARATIAQAQAARAGSSSSGRGGGFGGGRSFGGGGGGRGFR